jgi:hypothetical protein
MIVLGAKYIRPVANVKKRLAIGKSFVKSGELNDRGAARVIANMAIYAGMTLTFAVYNGIN